uniref:Uncharacterized protein n=1 Tax=Marseillevirus sp. TaxID=2809551 RepID=A0AA96EQL7_9VIRU|nr:hypothetical protein MarDSR_492 [Marseillevirus sp.]
MYRFLENAEYVSWRCLERENFQEEKRRLFQNKEKFLKPNLPNKFLDFLCPKELPWPEKSKLVLAAFEKKDSERLALLMNAEECTRFLERMDENFSGPIDFYKDIFFRGALDIQLLLYEREQLGSASGYEELASFFCNLLLEIKDK